MEEIREENKERYWRENQGDVLDLLQQLFYSATALLFSNNRTVPLSSAHFGLGLDAMKGSGARLG
jgi:hypothetical protein